MTHDYRHAPNSAYRYWLYDSDGGFLFYRSLAAREEAFLALLDAWRGEGEWPEEVEEICAGEVTHIATEVDRVDRPSPECLVDGEDEEGVYWADGCDYRCTYALHPVPVSEEVTP